MTGRPSYIWVNSASVGIGVVRALGNKHGQLEIYIDLSWGKRENNSLDDHD